MTELSTLERKPLSDLHQIAAQLGIEQYRKYRKPQLAELIYKTATEQAVGQQAAEVTTNGGETAAPAVAPETGTNGNGEATSTAPEITEARPDPFGEADTAIATPEDVEQRRPQQRGAASGAAGAPTPLPRPREKSSGAGSSSGVAIAVPTDSLSSAGTGAGKRASARMDASRRARGRGGASRGGRGGRARGGRREEGEGRDGRRREGQGQSGVLDVLPDGFGFLRTNGYSQGKGDVYVSTSQIKRFNLRRGDHVVGQIRPARDGEKYPALVRIESVNGHEPQKGRYRTNFDDLTPLYPMERLRLEWKPNDLAPRVVDLVAPIGKGQRGLIVSPPKAGKTTILKQVAQSIAANYPEAKLFVLLADERPEEVTDWERSVEEATVVSSTFDQPADNHIAVAELVLERVKRLVEEGEDVVVLLDSITRLARASNLAAPASGRTFPGRVASLALYPPKKFFGAARNIEDGGSLTILASALVETGGRMEEVTSEEVKGTGDT